MPCSYPGSQQLHGRPVLWNTPFPHKGARRVTCNLTSSLQCPIIFFFSSMGQMVNETKIWSYLRHGSRIWGPYNLIILKTCCRNVILESTCCSGNGPLQRLPPFVDASVPRLSLWVLLNWSRFMAKEVLVDTRPAPTPAPASCLGSQQPPARPVLWNPTEPPKNVGRVTHILTSSLQCPIMGPISGVEAWILLRGLAMLLPVALSTVK